MLWSLWKKNAVWAHDYFYFCCNTSSSHVASPVSSSYNAVSLVLYEIGSQTSQSEQLVVKSQWASLRLAHRFSVGDLVQQWKPRYRNLFRKMAKSIFLSSSPLCRQLAPCSSLQRCLHASHFSSCQWLKLTSFFFSQMKVCMDEFRSLAARYTDLHQSSFDADYATLRNVELYPSTSVCFGRCGGTSAVNNLLDSLLSQQQSCLLISHVIEALVLDPQAARWAPSNSITNVKTFVHVSWNNCSEVWRLLSENTLARKGQKLRRMKLFMLMYAFF